MAGNRFHEARPKGGIVELDPANVTKSFHLNHQKTAVGAPSVEGYSPQNSGGVDCLLAIVRSEI